MLIVQYVVMIKKLFKIHVCTNDTILAEISTALIVAV